MKSVRSMFMAVVCLLVFSPSLVWAQANVGKVKIDPNKVAARALRTADYGASRTTASARPVEEWLQFLAEYKTTNGSGKDAKGDKGWQDEVVVEWAVLIRRKDDKDILLKRTVTYVDVEDKRGIHYADLYLRPAFFRRYCKGVNPRDIHFRVQVKINGKTEDSYRSDKEEFRWWDWETPKVISKDSELLTRAETPFAPLDYDTYEHMVPTEPHK